MHLQEDCDEQYCEWNPGVIEVDLPGVGTCSINNTVGDDTLPIHPFYYLEGNIINQCRINDDNTEDLYMNQCLQINNMNNPTFNSDTVLFHDSEKYDFKFNDFVYEKIFLIHK